MNEPWWIVRQQRLRGAIARMKAKETITIVESIFSCQIENTIPGLNIIQREVDYFDDPRDEADIYLNPGYDHDLANLWHVTRTQRVGVTACWFWDNHHLFKSTMRAAMLADITFCAHGYAANYQNELGIDGGFVPLCGTFWSKTLVKTVLADVAGTPRQDHLYGGYNCYLEFAERTVFLQQVIASIPLNAIKLWMHGLPRADHGYYSKSHEEKLRDWCHYKVCLCVSFGSNTTMRIFEALLSGQIPIVVGEILDLGRIFTPSEEAMLPLIRVPAHDVEAIAEAHRRAVTRFDQEGQTGIDRRSAFALTHHMPRNRIVKMVEAIKNLSI